MYSGVWAEANAFSSFENTSLSTSRLIFFVAETNPFIFSNTATATTLIYCQCI